jgi:cation transport ATPase
MELVHDRSRRHPDPRRFLLPLAVWTAVLAASGIPVLLARPWLVWVVMAYGALLVVSLGFAQRRDERSLGNDLIVIVQCAAMVVVTYLVGGSWMGYASWRFPDLGAVPAHVWTAAVAVTLVLLGSTLHVKSLIRERGDARYARASRALASGSLVLAAALGIWWGLPAGWLLLAPFAYLLARSLMIPSPLRPAQLGMVELVGFLLLAGAIALAA